jgi:dUTP pyrophosphatase
MTTLKVKRLGPNFKAPIRKSHLAAGYDIHSAMETTIDPGDWKAVDTEMAIAIPEGYYGRVAPRSGLAVKHGIDVLAGVLDSDYRGHVKIVLINHSGDTFSIKIGDRIAQLIIEKIIIRQSKKSTN